MCSAVLLSANTRWKPRHERFKRIMGGHLACSSAPTCPGDPNPPRAPLTCPLPPAPAQVLPLSRPHPREPVTEPEAQHCPSWASGPSRAAAWAPASKCGSLHPAPLPLVLHGQHHPPALKGDQVIPGLGLSLGSPHTRRLALSFPASEAGPTPAPDDPGDRRVTSRQQVPGVSRLRSWSFPPQALCRAFPLALDGLTRDQPSGSVPRPCPPRLSCNRLRHLRLEHWLLLEPVSSGRTGVVSPVHWCAPGSKGMQKVLDKHPVSQWDQGVEGSSALGGRAEGFRAR